MSSRKSIRFNYEASEDLGWLFQVFRLMCNDAICIALGEKPRNRFALITLAYQRLKQYGLHSHYILSACEVAYAVCKNKNRGSDPYIKRAFVKLDNETYTLDDLTLRVPTRPREFIHLTLQGSDYHSAYLNDPSLKRGSVTLTNDAVSIAFKKEMNQTEPLAYIGIDLNERNITWSDSEGDTEKIDTSEIVDIRGRYRAFRARIARHTQSDMRVQQRLLEKYGRREKNRIVQRVHRITKRIVGHATTKRFNIGMENLKGIRRLYQKGNGQGSSYRERMNAWTFHEIQRQIEYKSEWNGVSTVYLSSRGTSRYCLCGSRVVDMGHRQLWCPVCDKTWDRDDLASKNILARMVLRDRPSRGRSEGEPGPWESDGNPPTRWMEASQSENSQQSAIRRLVGRTIKRLEVTDG